MAVKPLTNWYPRNTGKRASRATDLSTRDFSNRKPNSGNIRDSRPATNFTNNFATTLKDIDLKLISDKFSNPLILSTPRPKTVEWVLLSATVVLSSAFVPD